MKKLIVHQQKFKDCSDSFFYDGLIASIGKYRLIASGDIEIRNKKGDRVYARGKRYCDDIVFNCDKDLSKIGNSYDDKLYWENNNWFEVVYGKEVKNGQVVIENCDVGVVEYDYDSAIKMLKDYAKKGEINDISCKKNMEFKP